MVPLPKASWPHPWLQVSLLVRTILDTDWDAEQWAQIEPEIPAVLVAWSWIRQVGWFN